MIIFWILVFLLGSSFPTTAHAAGDALAEVDGVAITSEEVEKSLAGQLSKLEEQIYTLKRQKVDALINDKLLEKEAAKRKLTVPQLLDAEVTAKVGLVTEQEIEKFYQDNKAQIKGDDPQLREKIRAYLQNQKLAAKREEFLTSLRSQAKIVDNLKPPPVIRAEVAIAGAPVRGPAQAPVTIVEFSDFECPFCKRAHPTVTQLLEKYSGKVKLVYRDFPLESIHPQARRSAEAARCANDQGKFWEYYDVLFNESPKLSPDDLKRYGAQIGLDMTKFDACVAGAVHKAGVQKDLDEGTRLGVTGTPAFFINGRLISGAQPLEAFARVIDDELARNTVPASTKK
jgi:protein-disulfide isomerase